MQTATSETESKSRDLSICVHHYTLRAPCPKGQRIRCSMFPPFGSAKRWDGVDLTPYHRIKASDLRHPNVWRGFRAINLTGTLLRHNLALAEILRHTPNRWACFQELGVAVPPLAQTQTLL